MFSCILQSSPFAAARDHSTLKCSDDHITAYLKSINGVPIYTVKSNLPGRSLISLSDLTPDSVSSFFRPLFFCLTTLQHLELCLNQEKKKCFLFRVLVLFFLLEIFFSWFFTQLAPFNLKYNSLQQSLPKLVSVKSCLYYSLS